MKELNPMGKVRVTVGVPAYNEEVTIGRLLRDILSQPLDDKASLEEVIVNVSGSTDGTGAAVLEVSGSDPRVHLIAKEGREGKTAALNDILQYATGEIMVFIDGDTVLGEGSLNNLVKPLLISGDVGVASGHVVPLKEEEGFFLFASHFIRQLHHELCCRLVEMGLATKVDGSFYAFRRDILTRFPPYMISDDEYVSWRAQKGGYRVVYSPKAVVSTDDPSSFKSFINWQRRVILGQFYIKRDFGYSVPTMNPSLAISGFIDLVKKYRWRRIPEILGLALLGALSYIQALIMFTRKELPHLY